jgi:hypothetical protein
MQKIIILLYGMVMSVAVPVFAHAQTLCTTKSIYSDNPSSRNVIDWPFAWDSVWNMPIGCDATYVGANINPPIQELRNDEDILIVSKSSDPKVPVYKAGGDEGSGSGSGTDVYGKDADRCVGTVDILTKRTVSPANANRVHVPINFILPSRGGNFATAHIAPDGVTMRQMNAGARCTAGGPLYGIGGNFITCTERLDGDGITCPGGHGGSGLSSLGGTLRKQDFMNDEPIRHALKIALRGWQYHCGSSGGKCTPRWPASNSDVRNQDSYNPVSAMKMGALLAIHPSATYESLGIKSKAGKKLFDVMQDYGGYTVDGGGHRSERNSPNVSMHEETIAQFKKYYGHDWTFNLTRNSTTPDAGTEYARWADDVNAIFSNLYVVDDNTPSSIGGKGDARRAPYAPKLDGSSWGNYTYTNPGYTTGGGNTTTPITTKQGCTTQHAAMTHGVSKPFYSTEQADDCDKNKQIRTCNDGVLTGDSKYKYIACDSTAGTSGSKGGALTCTLDGVTIPKGASRFFYDTQQADDCTLHRQDRRCTNENTLNGDATYKYATCIKTQTTGTTTTITNPQPLPTNPTTCEVGTVTLQSGQDKDFYRVQESTNCANEKLNRVCDEGVLSGEDLYLYPTCTPITIDQCIEEITQPYTAIKNYGYPHDFNQTLIRAQCTNSVTRIDIGTTQATKNSDLYIYHTGYTFNRAASTWDPVTFSCTYKEGNFCVGNAHQDLPRLNSAQPNYIAAYICKRQSDGSFDCGCRDQLCSGGKTGLWRVQRIEEDHS